jgi:CBS domain-containing protein
MAVGEFCSRDVVMAERNSPVPELARLMREYHVGDVVVVDSAGTPTPVGIVTDRDIVVEVMAEGVPADSVTAGDIMSADVVTARENDGLWDTLRRMRSGGVRRVPVVDPEQGRLVGIISADDILELLSEELTALAHISPRERSHERTERP